MSSTPANISLPSFTPWLSRVQSRYCSNAWAGSLVHAAWQIMPKAGYGLNAPVSDWSTATGGDKDGQNHKTRPQKTNGWMTSPIHVTMTTEQSRRRTRRNNSRGREHTGLNQNGSCRGHVAARQGRPVTSLICCSWALPTHAVANTSVWEPAWRGCSKPKTRWLASGKPGELRLALIASP